MARFVIMRNKMHVENACRYAPLYSNDNPILHEADVFRITVPPDDEYSFSALSPIILAVPRGSSV